jgi:sulfur relay (sulfurtransferase) DsrC/TusE family protein
LKIRFRRSFDEFLREVEDAYGRWMARPTARMLVKKLQKDLKQWHQDMLYYKLLDNDPINFVAGLYYRRSNGTWHVDDSSLRQWWRLIDL